MNKRFLLLIVLVFAISVFSSSALACTCNPMKKYSSLIGTITKVSLRSRTIEVRDRGDGIKKQLFLYKDVIDTLSEGDSVKIYYLPAGRRIVGLQKLTGEDVTINFSW